MAPQPCATNPNNQCPWTPEEWRRQGQLSNTVETVKNTVERMETLLEEMSRDVSVVKSKQSDMSVVHAKMDAFLADPRTPAARATQILTNGGVGGIGGMIVIVAWQMLLKYVFGGKV